MQQEQGGGKTSKKGTGKSVPALADGAASGSQVAGAAGAEPGAKAAAHKELARIHISEPTRLLSNS